MEFTKNYPPIPFTYHNVVFITFKIIFIYSAVDPNGPREIDYKLFSFKEKNGLIPFLSGKYALSYQLVMWDDISKLFLQAYWFSNFVPKNDYFHLGIHICGTILVRYMNEMPLRIIANPAQENCSILLLG